MPGGVVEGRHLGNEGRKPGPVPWGLPPPGPASVPPRGRAWASGSPPTAGRRPPRKGSVGISGAWSPERMARAKRVHGGGDSPPGSRRPSRPLPASREGAVRPTGPATAVPRLGNGARCPGKPPGRPPAKQGRSPTASCERSRGRRPKGPAGPQAVESPGLRDALIPKGPPLLPPAHRRGVSALWGPPSRSALLCRGDAPPTKGRVPAKSAGAPTPAGSRVRVPRPMGDGAG
jgi:hypothetical protein